MPENLNILAELTSNIISFIVGMPLECGNSIVNGIIARKVLEKKIRKRQKYLISKYENKLELLNRMDKDYFYKWLKEKETINRIVSFSNAKYICNISTEQMQHSKEIFFADSFKMANVHDLYEKEELRKMLNDLFQYIDELFWKTIDENDVFIYKKCVLELKQSVRKSTEEIIYKIKYQDSFAEYIDNQKVLLEVPFKLDYRFKNIPFIGRTEELKEIEAFCASEKQISWWAILGKGGSGKSRLVYQYIKNNIDSSDWKMCFLPEEFFNQVNGGGKYKKWSIWTYDKNLLLVVDYAQKYIKEVAQWIEGLFINNSITRKIRILLLERTEDWIREEFNKQVIDSIKYGKDFLELSSLKENLNEFAYKYTKINGGKISEEEIIDAREKLKTIDSDERILYYIIILEAILKKEPWRNWNRINFVDYIVRKEQEYIAVRFKNNKNVIRSFNRLLAFCTATKELPIFEWPKELPELIKNEIKEIHNNTCNKHELSIAMQLDDGILQPITPDIIGEYMVLYIIEQYFFNKNEKEMFIKSLWAYDSGNFLFFVYRLLEDKMDRGSYNDIIKLMLFDAIPHDNIYIMKNYAKLMWGLVAISDLNQAHMFVEILEKIYRDYPLDKSIACSYATGLYNLSVAQELSEKKETLGTLEHLAAKYINNAEIQEIYAAGLFALSNFQELSERKETLDKLEHFSSRYANNTKIQGIYAKGLLNLSGVQEPEERKETIGRLEHLAIRFVNYVEIQVVYAEGLLNLTAVQGLEGRKETIEKLEHLFREFTDNVEIQEIYAKGLFNLSLLQKLPEILETVEKMENLTKECINNAAIQETYAKGLHNLSLFQELPERKETIESLEYLYIRNADNNLIQIEYAKGLTNLSYIQKLSEVKETILRLEYLASKYADNVGIQAEYAKGLVNLSREQELEERTETIRKLEHIAIENANNAVIQVVYAKGLYNLSCVQELDQRKQTLEKLEHLAIEYINNDEIQIEYSEGLFSLSCVQELSGIKQAVEKLEHLAREHTNNDDIQINYAKALVNLNYRHKMFSLKKESTGKLERLYKKHVDNAEIQTAYAMGLYNLCLQQELPEIKETIKKLKNLARKHDDNIRIQEKYARGLVKLGTKQGMSEKIGTVEKLEYLYRKYIDNVLIQTAYAYGLCDLSNDQEFPEIIETIEKLEYLAREYAGNTKIQIAYAEGLWILSLDQRLPEIKETVEKLRHLARENPNNTVVQEIYADVIVKLNLFI